jgi:hypothetical protein
MEFHENRYRRAQGYLAYFQPFSNTYAPLSRLKEIYSQALDHPAIAGMIIGTRPDCVTPEIMEYLVGIARKKFVVVEFGLESCYDKTLSRINRGHTFGESLRALELAAEYGIPAGVHMIFGLPGETMQEMLDEALILSALPIHTIKFHQLQIVKGTRMAREFAESTEAFHIFSLEEYIEFIIDFTERLNPAFVIERFAGEVPPRFLDGPGWGLVRNDQVLNRIEKRMEERGAWQGKLWRF